ncbi:MAG: class I SAM-dependent methyltransferase [Myxococcota bacterium]
MKPDFGLTAEDYARFRAGFPDSFYERLAARGIGRADQRVTDLGTGTGTLARGFARRGCRVTGVDPAGAMLAEASRLSAEAGLDIPTVLARAEATGLADDSADVVVAGQCWHWFDRPAAAREAARLLAASGVLVIGHLDWIPTDGNVVEATERLIEAHNPAWQLGGGAGLYPMWLRDLTEAGYTELETWSYDVDLCYPPEAWRGRIRASAGIGASLPPEAVNAFDRDLAALLAERFPGASVSAHHRVFTLIARPPV